MTTADIVKDQIVVFTGYAEKNLEPLLTPGQQVRIFSVVGDGSFSAVPVETNEDGSFKEGDTVYRDEFQTLEEFAAAQAEASGTGQAVDSEVAADLEAASAPEGKKNAAQTKKVVEAKAAEAVAPAKSKPGKGKGKGKTTQAAAAEGEQGELPVSTGAAPATGTSDVLEVTHSSSVAALLAEHDALEAAEELVRRSDETEFTLGGVLAHIQREGIHQRLGFQGKRGFEDYIEQRLGLKYRKARYLINIYEYFTNLGIDETRLSAMGWSKAKELVGKATLENFDDLVEYAEGHTREQLIEHLRTSYTDAGDGSDTGTSVKQTRLTFALFADQASTVTRALDAAKQQAGSDDPNQALEHICAEWSLMNESQQLTLDEALAAMEARYGVTLRQVHETGGQTDIEDALAEQEQVSQTAAE